MNFIEQLKKNIKNNKRGFSLLELVLAVAIFSFSSFALATMIIDSNISTRLSADRTDALLYAKEGVEAVRSIRDNDWTSWASTTDRNYGLSINIASSTWELSGESDLIDNKYTRTVNIVTDPVVSTSKDVTVNIAWDLTSGRMASTTLLTIFSNWPSVINSDLVVPGGLVSYWSFDDAGSGTALDSVGENNGTVDGATATTSVKGVANQAYGFDGSSDYIAINGTNLNLITDWTYSAWIKRAGVGARVDVIFDHRTSNSAGRQIAIYIPGDVRQNKIQVDIPYVKAIFVGNTEIADTNWHLVTITKDNSTNTWTSYVDGVYDNSVVDATAQESTTADFLIGKFQDNVAYLNGSIDNVRIYNRAITAEEVTTIYNAEKPN